MKFKNILAVTLISTCLLTSNTFASNIGTVTSSVNVREGASTSSNIVSTLNSGDRVTVTGATNGFYSIDQNGTTRYVSSDFTNIEKADGIVTGEGVFVRQSPSLDAEVTGILSMNTPVTVVGQTGDWYQLQDGDKLAYIHKDFISGDYVDLVGDPITGSTSASNNSNVSASTYYRINASGGLNLRDSASASGNKIAVIPDGYVVSGLDEVNGFTKVNYNGTLGYVSTDFISETSAPTYGASTVSSDASTGTKIVQWAEQFIGTPYVYSGTNLNSGVDCSGFVYSVFRENPYYNVTLNRVAADQYNNGTKISKSELQSGDLVFFDTSGANNGVITHSGIYYGNGKFIHSSSGSAQGVTISDLTSGYYLNTYVGASRVIN